MDNNNTNASSSGMGAFGQMIGRFVVAAIILGITAFFTPGFSINNIWSLGIANIGDVEYAILETNGQLSVIEKPEKRNVTTEDLNIQAEYEGISYDLVLDGKVMYENLKKIGKNYTWLKKEVGKFNMKPEEALIVVQNGDQSIFCQKKERK